MMDKIWIANLLTGTAVIGVITFLFNRFIKTYDERLKAAEDEAEDIKKNYIRRFEDVHRKLDDTTLDIKEHFNRKIEDVNNDRMVYRMNQAKSMGILETKIDFIIKQNNNHK